MRRNIFPKSLGNFGISISDPIVEYLKWEISIIENENVRYICKKYFSLILFVLLKRDLDSEQKIFLRHAPKRISEGAGKF